MFTPLMTSWVWSALRPVPVTSPGPPGPARPAAHHWNVRTTRHRLEMFSSRIHCTDNLLINLETLKQVLRNLCVYFESEVRFSSEKKNRHDSLLTEKIYTLTLSVHELTLLSVEKDTLSLNTKFELWATEKGTNHQPLKDLKAGVKNLMAK